MHAAVTAVMQPKDMESYVNHNNLFGQKDHPVDDLGVRAYTHVRRILVARELENMFCMIRIYQV